MLLINHLSLLTPDKNLENYDFMSSLLCALDPAAAESRSKKQLGSESRSILGDTSQWMKVSLFYFNPIKI
jgi:hypothetical protein